MTMRIEGCLKDFFFFRILSNLFCLNKTNLNKTKTHLEYIDFL